MRSRLISVAALALVVAGQASADSALTGHVFELKDGGRKPADGAWVVASSGSPSRTVATAATNASGEFELAGLPEGRVEFRVSRRGYFTVEAGGAAAETLTRSCPAEGSCGEANFVTARAGVIEGYVTDPFGEPIVDAAVRLTKAGEVQDGPPMGPPRFRGRFDGAAHTTDDRGYFRIYGVAAGEYQLEVRAGRLLQALYTAEPQTISIETNETPPPLYIAMSAAAEPVHVGGVIDGLNLKNEEFVRILAVRSAGGLQRPMAPLRAESGDGGAPRLSGELPPGDYLLMAEIVSRAGPGRGFPPGRALTLGRYRIDHDTTGLRLTATPGATFSGRIRFDGMAPRPLNLTLTPLDGGTPDAVRFGPNGRFQGMGGFGRSTERFERTALVPGRYRLSANSNDYFIEGETEFLLSEGATLETEIVVSGALAEVHGQVRPPKTDDPTAKTGPFLVALKNAEGKTIATQTDDAGRFSFAKLRPGDYQVCAWTDVSVEAGSDGAWAAAGEAVKRFPIAAGDQTELLLTAKP